MEVLCGLWLSLSDCGTIWNPVGQFGESGEYQMGRVRVADFHIWSFEGGSPRLSQSMIDQLALMSKLDYVLAHIGFMVSHKLSSFDDHWVGR
jgi:hypothetical protein